MNKNMVLSIAYLIHIMEIVVIGSHFNPSLTNAVVACVVNAGGELYFSSHTIFGLYPEKDLPDLPFPELASLDLKDPYVPLR